MYRLFLLIVATTLLPLTVAAQEPTVTLTTIADFGEGDGQYPSPLAQGLDGNLYGTVLYPHRTDTGADSFFFDLTTSGAYTNLPGYSCTTNYCTGSKPYSGLTLAGDGNFYGTTSFGGNGEYRTLNAAGTLYRANAQRGLTTLYSFCSKLGCQDGDDPYTPLTLGSDGNLYGTTQVGGLHKNGTAFVITLAGKFNTIHQFCAQANCVDGANPDGLIQATDGNFYGVATGGAATSLYCNGCGIIFRMTSKGVTSTLYSFCSLPNCADGGGPTALIQAADGDLYGLTRFGGIYATSQYSGGGTIFKLTLQGQLTTLYNFCNVSGCEYSTNANSIIQATDGNFYGTVYDGVGVADCYWVVAGCGEAFELTSSGVYTTLYSFCQQLGEYCPDGSLPLGIIQATDGNFYGTTSRGGPSGYGTAFELSTGLASFVQTVTSSGAVGASVIILGNNLTGTTNVTFSGTPALFTILSTTEITATVPKGATTGPVEVTTPNATLKSNRTFIVN